MTSSNKGAMKLITPQVVSGNLEIGVEHTHGRVDKYRVVAWTIEPELEEGGKDPGWHYWVNPIVVPIDHIVADTSPEGLAVPLSRHGQIKNVWTIEAETSGKHYTEMWSLPETEPAVAGSENE